MDLKACLDWWLRWLLASLVFFAQLGGIGLLFLVAFMSDSGSIRWPDLARAAASLLGSLALAAVIVGTTGAFLSAIPSLLLGRLGRASSDVARPWQPKPRRRSHARRLSFGTLTYLTIGGGATLLLAFSLLTVAIHGTAALQRGDRAEAVVGTIVFISFGAVPALFILRWVIRCVRARREHTQ